MTIEHGLPGDGALIVAAASWSSRLEFLEHRLHRADDEGQADEDQRDDDTGGGVGDLPGRNLQALSPKAASPAPRSSC